MAYIANHPRFKGKPYLQRLETIKNAFPALNTFLEKLANENDPGREAVRSYYRSRGILGPGRCYCLNFDNEVVTVVGDSAFEDPASLRAYLEDHPAAESRKKNCRLFILEDMDPDYVDALGFHLGVDPLIFSEQMNTWNFTDSWSIPHRGLPSMSEPEQAFTLRYYELRTLLEPKSIDVLSLQLSFAINRRRYERWRDIDVPSAGKPDRRHAFVRRCTSFWTSQAASARDDTSIEGWDAVILVDPAFAVARERDYKIQGNQELLLDEKAIKIARPDGLVLDAAAMAGLEECLILKTPVKYASRASLWNAQNFGISQNLGATAHRSWPYHNGCSTLAPLMFSQVGIGAQEANIKVLHERRTPGSALDDMVFYWTKLATPDLIKQTRTRSSNAAYYLLKRVAQHWVNQLEIMNTTISKAEWFSDDYQARIDDNLTRQKWKADLIKINEIAKDINYMRRHLNHFWRAMTLNLERLGIQLGAEAVDENAPIALRGAQKDFLTIHTRMKPLRDRAEGLNSVSNDLSNLRAAFRGIQDAESGLRLSLFASIVFPLTLVAGIFSMNDDYLPGRPNFWKLWAYGPPFCAVVALGLTYGSQPWRLFFDIWESTALWLERHGFERSASEGERDLRNSDICNSTRRANLKRRAGWRTQDEEQGVLK